MAQQAASKNYTGIFRSAVLDPHTALGTTGGHPDTITVYKFPDASLDGSGGKAAAMALILSANRKTRWEVEEAATYICTLAELIEPGLMSRIGGNRLVNIRVINKTENVVHFSSTAWSDEVPDDNPSHVSKRSMDPVVLDEMGGMGADPFSITPIEDTDDMTDEVVGGRWGIEMFVIGKQPTQDNLIAFRVNRPRAVIGRYKMRDEQKDYLDGSYAATFETLQAIATAFDIFPHLRHALGSHWIDVMGLGGNRLHRAFGLTFKLTDGAGFNGPIAIAALLASYPCLRDYPLLKNQIADADKLFQKFRSLSAERRGFLKVLYGPEFSHFKTINRGALMAVATAFMTMTNGSFKNFMDISPFENFIAKLNDWLVIQGQPAISITPVEAGAGAAGGLE